MGKRESIESLESGDRNGALGLAGVLRPVERDLGFPTAPADYSEAS